MKKDSEQKKKKRHTVTLGEYVKRIGIKYKLLYLLLPLIFILIIFLNYRMIQEIMSENIKNKAESTLLRYSDAMDEFMRPGIRIIESMSYNVEDMLRNDEDSDAIEEFLIRETETLEDVENLETTGIYGYIKGEYLDGYMWVPDADYVPTERPWYKDAVRNGGKLTYVEPYIDMMTGDKVMTICKMLSDGKSVVAIDIKINRIQGITEALISADDDTSEVIVLDNDGLVVAHSDAAEVDKNYLETDEEPARTIGEKLLKEGQDCFSLQYENGKDMVYAMGIGGGWYMLSVTNEKKMFSRVINAFANSLIVSYLGTVLILGVLFAITKKGMEAEDYNIDLSSVSSIYLCMYKINLKEDSFEEISCSLDKVALMVGEKRTEARKVLNNVINLRSDNRNHGDIIEFTDIDTLEERLKNTDTITCEFMNTEQVWNRARFIVAERNTDGSLKSVLFMVELIDEEKKTRDRLLYLSETDRMTGINNRGSGENKVRKLMIDGDGGMFILLDIDKFKSINDNYGHDVGDKVLIAIAGCMKKAFRNNDVVMRLGGDEFAAFAPLVFDKDGGEIIVERFIDRVKSIRIPEMGDRAVEVSVGVSFYGPEDSFSFEELYRRADKCTYESKEHSGSYVTFFHV